MFIAAFVLLSVIFAFVAGELAVRLWNGQLFTWRNQVERRFELAVNACANDYDPHLGWVPMRAKSGLENRWSTRVHITDHGFRANLRDGKEL